MNKITKLRSKKVTPKNEFIFKQQIAIWYGKGLVPKDLYLKVQQTDYSKCGVCLK